MIRPMEKGDIPYVEQIEAACFSDRWSACMLEEGLESRFDWFWVAQTQMGMIAGYCNLRIVAGEGELMRIAVRPEFRGHGFGKKLMETLVSFARDQEARQMSLEVRAGNEAAINLYKCYGFRGEAVRRAYYRDPKEDAVIMLNRCI